MIARSTGLRALRRGQPNQRVVAVTPRQFGKSEAVLRSGYRYPDGGEDLAVGQSGLEQALEKYLGLDRALAGRAGDVDLAVEREQTGRQFRRRVGKGDRSADGTAVANRRMGNVRYGGGEQWCQLRDLGTVLGLHVAHQGAKFDLAVVAPNLPEFGQPVDVDQ